MISASYEDFNKDSEKTQLALAAINDAAKQHGVSS